MRDAGESAAEAHGGSTAKGCGLLYVRMHTDSKN